MGPSVATSPVLVPIPVLVLVPVLVWPPLAASRSLASPQGCCCCSLAASGPALGPPALASRARSMDQSVAIQETLANGATCRIISFAPQFCWLSSLFRAHPGLRRPCRDPIAVCCSLTPNEGRAGNPGWWGERGEPAAGPGGELRRARVGAGAGRAGGCCWQEERLQQSLTGLF